MKITNRTRKDRTTFDPRAEDEFAKLADRIDRMYGKGKK